MKIRADGQGPYHNMIEAVRELTKIDGHEVIDTYILHIKTGTLGEENILMLWEMRDDYEGYYFLYDWWKGGEIELLGYTRLSDIKIQDNVD